MGWMEMRDGLYGTLGHMRSGQAVRPASPSSLAFLFVFPTSLFHYFSFSTSFGVVIFGACHRLPAYIYLSVSLASVLCFVSLPGCLPGLELDSV
jgi:hypothetical protein